MKPKLFALFLILTVPFASGYAQTVMSPADVLFTGYNSNDGTNGATMNQVSLVILRPGGLDAGTTFHLTDNGYSPVTAALTTNEGDITVTLSASLPQFTEIFIQANNSGTAIEACQQNSSGSFSSDNISATISGTFQLSTGGDQVFVFQGSMASPAFITGIHMNSEIPGGASQPPSTAAAWDIIAAANGPDGWIISNSRSGIPPSLLNGVNAIMGVQSPGTLSAEKDNGIFNCNQSSTGTVEALKARLTNVSNWILSEPAPMVLPSGCPYAMLANDSFELPEISYVPNPTSGTIAVSGRQNISQLVVLSLSGQELMKTDVNADNGIIDLSHFASGCYFLKIVSDTGARTVTILKQ